MKATLINLLAVFCLCPMPLVAASSLTQRGGFTSEAQARALMGGNSSNKEPAAPSVAVGPRLPTHPFRMLKDEELGVRYWDLRLLNSSPRPEFLKNWEELYVKVSKILDDGLVLCEIIKFRTVRLGGRFTFSNVDQDPTYIAIANFPHKNPADGDRHVLVVYNTGKTHSYTDVTGAKSTVRVYDYGIPYNPFEKK